MATNLRCAAHQFDDSSISFSPVEYSMLKFGDDVIARRFGAEVAAALYDNHLPLLLDTQCVVIASPYNFVHNAATVMSKYVIDNLNGMLSMHGGYRVETTVIHRKVTYTNDYGFLEKDKRKSLLSGDEFYINEDFIKDKTLIMVDDVRITGTHEDKLIDVLAAKGLDNTCIYTYFAEYGGDLPSIESRINFAAIRTIEDYVQLSKRPNHHLIVRPIKYMLSQEPMVFVAAMQKMPAEFIQRLYFACIGEGYHQLPQYQITFAMLRQMATQRNKRA